MKLKTLSFMFFLLFFAVGLGVVLLTPQVTTASAGEPCDLDPNNCGSVFGSCVSSQYCSPGLADEYRWFKDPNDINCTGGYTLSCRIKCNCSFE